MKFQKILSLGIGICIFLALIIGFGFSDLTHDKQKTDISQKLELDNYEGTFKEKVEKLGQDSVKKLEKETGWKLNDKEKIE